MGNGVFTRDIINPNSARIFFINFIKALHKSVINAATCIKMGREEKKRQSDKVIVSMVRYFPQVMSDSHFVIYSVNVMCVTEMTNRRVENQPFFLPHPKHWESLLDGS